MGYDARQVANFILDLCDRRQRQITNLSLQKVVYFCHVWSLIELDRPLLRHNFEAWKYGPVIQYLYRDFRDFDRSPISARSMSLDPLTGKYIVVNYDFDSETQALLSRVANFYTQLSASELVRLSHVTDGPWHHVWNHVHPANPGMQISNASILEFYSKVSLPFSLQ